MSSFSAPPRAIIALWIAFMNVAAIFQMLARPVREWAGERWPVYMGVVVVIAACGATGAYGLGQQQPWARKVLGAWSVGIVVAVAALLLFGGHRR